jgi:hypothetical protein
MKTCCAKPFAVHTPDLASGGPSEAKTHGFNGLCYGPTISSKKAPREIRPYENHMRELRVVTRD